MNKDQGDWEEELFETIASIAEKFGWELSKRDPGPPEECQMCEVFNEGGYMPPIHACPQEVGLGFSENELAKAYRDIDAALDFIYSEHQHGG